MAGHRYSVVGDQNVASPTDTVISINGVTTRRAWVTHFTLGSSATPADNAILWEVRLFTASGTGTAFTPRALDPGNPAALLTAEVNHTVEPTYTASSEVFSMPLNQRAPWQWWANPESELVIPATADTGYGWEPTHASFTGSVEVCAYYLE